MLHCSISFFLIQGAGLVQARLHTHSTPRSGNSQCVACAGRPRKSRCDPGHTGVGAVQKEMLRRAYCAKDGVLSADPGLELR